MEALADPYRCLLHVRGALESGDGLRTALRSYLALDRDEFTVQLGIWLSRYEQGHEKIHHRILKRNSYRRALLSLLAAGLNGEAIYDRLGELESEFHAASLREIETQLAALPFKLMVPLLLFQFPAFLLLLFGPILLQLKESFS